MLRATTLLSLLCLNVGLSYGMQCSLGHKNIITEVLDSCPGLLDSSDKSYCCVDIEKNRMYCCDETEFLVKSTWLLLTMIAVVVIIISLIVCCVSCLCCRCCPWYRRRHPGTVYGHMTQPPPYSEVVYDKQAPYNPSYVASNQP